MRRIRGDKKRIFLTNKARFKLAAMELSSAIEGLTRELLSILESAKYDFSKDNRARVPSEPGVYTIYEKTRGYLLYIGESKHLRRRIFGEHLTGDKIASAFRRNLSDWEKLGSEEDVSAYISDKCEFQFKQCDEAAAKRLEHFAIAILQPLLNR